MTPQLARRLLALATVLGIAADYFLRGPSWRAGFVVWVLTLLGFAFGASERAEEPTDASNDASNDAPQHDATARRERRLLYAAAALLALLLILRDAALLYGLNFAGFVVVLCLIAWRAHGQSLTRLEPRDAIIGVASAVAAGAAGGPLLVAQDARLINADASWRHSVKTFAIGSLVAMPVLLIVTGLLAEADPTFGHFLDALGTLLEFNGISHVALIVVATWLTAGALRGSLKPVAVDASRLRGRLDAPFSAVAPILGGLSLLLTFWIGLQVRTLFGGREYLIATAGVTLADYARRGFFELIVIGGIVLAVLLVADDLLDRDHIAARRSFRTLGLLLVALVGAVLVSAVLRLALYLEHFGLTDDRVLALAVLLWMALVLTWFAMTVLRGERGRFAPGVLVVSALWLGMLNVLNPERWIVELNVRRAEAGLEFDVAYHAALSGDAVPTLIRSAPRLGAERAADLRSAMEQEWMQRRLDRADWRRWSVPYWRVAK